MELSEKELRCLIQRTADELASYARDRDHATPSAIRALVTRILEFTQAIEAARDRRNAELGHVRAAEDGR